MNQFDTIDFTDNELRRLDGFPLLPKIKSLLLNNNKIQYVAVNLEHYVPNLETLVMTNNNIEELYEIDNLSTIKTLRTLSLLRNPVASLRHYRLYTIYKMPFLRVLDFKKVKDKVFFLVNIITGLVFLFEYVIALKKERKEALSLFKGKKLKKSDKPRTFVPGEQIKLGSFNQGNQEFSEEIHHHQVQRSQPSKEELNAIRVSLLVLQRLV